MAGITSFADLGDAGHIVGQIIGGKVEVSNAGSGATRHFDVHNSSSLLKVVNCQHTSSLNVGSVVVVDEDAANTKTRVLAAIPNATAGAAGGLFVAGSNAPTTVNITGNLSGSVGTATSLGATPQGTLNKLEAAFASSGVFSTPSLVNAPTGGGSGSISPLQPGDDETWRFDDRAQLTSPDILVFTVGGDNSARSMDFTRALKRSNGSAAIQSVAATAISPSSDAPLIVDPAKSADGKAVNLMIDATDEEIVAGTYVLSITITTTDSQTVTRRGRLRGQ